jgi:hypothetical protein
MPLSFRTFAIEARAKEWKRRDMGILLVSKSYFFFA